MDIQITPISDKDYDPIINGLNDWWGGRNMTDMLPRLFFKHFTGTSLIARSEELIAGFIIGFISQDNPELAYVHFIGVNPDFREQKLGKRLYDSFFKKVAKQGIQEVECVTSIDNKASIQFHRKMGFRIVPGSSEKKGISYTQDYDGPEEHRVVFRYHLENY
ncbi:GNAT family N-acetyltransferase [bacterium SCSIO 12741]|nr:GNAT family N-acetyltransferase [bacterium SCSIO 12741]